MIGTRIAAIVKDREMQEINLMMTQVIIEYRSLSTDYAHPDSCLMPRLFHSQTERTKT